MIGDGNCPKQLLVQPELVFLDTEEKSSSKFKNQKKFTNQVRIYDQMTTLRKQATEKVKG